MSAVKDKGNINYIQILHVQVQQKVPRKILEKFFIIKKCTQYKTSHTLKFYLFELPDNKHFGKFFSKYEVLFLDQSNFSSNPFQILILQRFPCSLAISVKFHTGQLTPLLETILIMFFIGFSILSYPIRPYTLITGFTKTYTKPRQSNDY